MALSITAGDYIATITNYRIEKSTPGSQSLVTLSQPLPDEILQAINSGFDVYAALGCRSSSGQREYVRVQSGSYDANDQSLRIIRGQSWSASGLNGDTFAHSGGNIKLDFNVTYPASTQELAQEIRNIRENTEEYIQANTPIASSSTSGLVKTSWTNPNADTQEPYQVISFDNPALQLLYARLFSLADTSNTLQFAGDIDQIVYDRLNKLSAILGILDNNDKYNSFINWLNQL